jgi:peptidyl-prolyl cis-trans isomerase C
MDLLVNGERLRARDIAAEVGNFPAATPAESWRQAREAMVLRLLVNQRARASGIAAEPRADAAGRTETGEDALLRALIDAEIPAHRPAEAEIAAFHAGHAERFRSPDLFAASHILIAAPEGDTEARARARALAGTLRSELETAPDRFAALAAEHSDCPSRANGGALGQISPGEVAPAFEAALHALVPGTVSGPVETPFGIHLIRLDARAEGRLLPLAAVRDRIADYLGERDRRRAIAGWLAGLRGGASVVPVPPLSASPSGQLPREDDHGAWTQLVSDLNRQQAGPAAPGG